MSHIFQMYSGGMQQAVVTDDAAAVAKLLEGSKLSLDHVAKESGTLLHRAIGHGAMSVARLLLERGADVNVADKEGVTPLLLAFFKTAWDNGATCRFLLDHGADINAKDKKGDTALHYAVRKNNLPAVDAALKHGVDVAAKGARGYTALHLACGGGSATVAEEIFDRLLAAGAPVNALDDSQWMPMHFAVYFEKAALVQKLLAQGADWQASVISAKQQLTPFQLSVQRGSVDLARIFVEQLGEDPAQRTATGRTMIQVASKQLEMQTYLRSVKTEIAIQDAIFDNGMIGTGSPPPVRSVAGMSPL